MNKTEKRELIKNWICTPTGKINARKINSIDQFLMDVINEVTNFLPPDSSLNERLHCIIDGLLKTPTCPYCDLKRSFVLYRGYRYTCGSKACSMRYRLSKGERMGFLRKA